MSYNGSNNSDMFSYLAELGLLEMDWEPIGQPPNPMPIRSTPADIFTPHTSTNCPHLQLLNAQMAHPSRYPPHGSHVNCRNPALAYDLDTQLDGLAAIVENGRYRETVDGNLVGVQIEMPPIAFPSTSRPANIFKKSVTWTDPVVSQLVTIPSRANAYAFPQEPTLTDYLLSKSPVRTFDEFLNKVKNDSQHGHTVGYPFDINGNRRPDAACHNPYPTDHRMRQTRASLTPNWIQNSLAIPNAAQLPADFAVTQKLAQSQSLYKSGVEIVCEVCKRCFPDLVDKLINHLGEHAGNAKPTYLCVSQHNFWRCHTRKDSRSAMVEHINKAHMEHSGQIKFFVENTDGKIENAWSFWVDMCFPSERDRILGFLETLNSLRFEISRTPKEVAEDGE